MCSHTHSAQYFPVNEGHVTQWSLKEAEWEILGAYLGKIIVTVCVEKYALKLN